MAASDTVEVPHLGGIKVGYRLSKSFDKSKPTFVLVNSMCMTVSLYDAQFSSTPLTDTANLLAIEPLGHGSTSCSTEHFTYWDSAIMALQAMEKLGITKAFALGTSQGGWIVARMALLAPEKISGLLLLGTSMDYESSDSRTKGCWDPRPLLTPFFENWCTPNPDFVIDDVWCGMVSSIGFADGVTAEATEFWGKTLKSVYAGDAGRVKAKLALLNLLNRDGLLDRLRDIRCPVYWLQGTKDVPYGVTIPAEQIKLFINSKDTKLEILEGGGHYLNATNPKETEKYMLELVSKYP